MASDAQEPVWSKTETAEELVSWAASVAVPEAAHVWMAPGLQEFCRVMSVGRLQSCVRPVGAVRTLTAGPDGMRGS
jgi:hypothetical protein